jgi:hypothetical protein
MVPSSTKRVIYLLAIAGGRTGNYIICLEIPSEIELFKTEVGTAGCALLR